jgi:hypothetical protein
MAMREPNKPARVSAPPARSQGHSTRRTTSESRIRLGILSLSERQRALVPPGAQIEIAEDGAAFLYIGPIPLLVAPSLDQLLATLARAAANDG